jgi:hypothetical protein
MWEIIFLWRIRIKCKKTTGPIIKELVEMLRSHFLESSEELLRKFASSKVLFIAHSYVHVQNKVFNGENFLIEKLFVSYV